MWSACRPPSLQFLAAKRVAELKLNLADLPKDLQPLLKIAAQVPGNSVTIERMWKCNSSNETDLGLPNGCIARGMIQYLSRVRIRCNVWHLVSA